MNRRTALFIAGAWQDVPAPPLTVFNATTGEPMASVPAAGAAEANAAAEAAAAAFGGWSMAPAAERAQTIGRIADGLVRRADELAATITAEVGTPLRLSERIQVGLPLQAWRNYAALAADFAAESALGNSRLYREAVGPVACITPWNYPLHQATAKVAAALAVGATVVLKPSEVAPLSAFILAEVIAEAGAPKGVFNLVTGLGPIVGEALVRHPAIAKVSFTGSTRAGRRVAALAAEGLKRVALELGGKSAAIVLDGGDLNAAVKATLASCLLNSGQTCNALTRLIVPRERFGEVADIIRALLPTYVMGDPAQRATRLGPLASATQRETVHGVLAAAAARGAPVIARNDMPDGLPGGFFVPPVVFGPVEADDPLAQEEIFGPVLTVLTHAGEADAIRLANAARYGLAAAVWTGDEAQAVRVARHVRAGQVDVNGGPFNLSAPFGGFGESGYGRENGPFGLDEFVEWKSLQFGL